MKTKNKSLATWIRNPGIVWYGPHECNGCGQTIVKSSIESGGKSLNAPHNHHYPNHKWVEHKCESTNPKGNRTLSSLTPDKSK